MSDYVDFPEAALRYGYSLRELAASKESYAGALAGLSGIHLRQGNIRRGIQVMRQAIGVRVNAEVDHFGGDVAIGIGHLARIGQGRRS